MNVFNGKEYSEDDLKRIAKNVASSWGAKLRSWSVIEDDKLEIISAEDGHKVTFVINDEDVQDYDY
jgi:hypothetical protein